LVPAIGKKLKKKLFRIILGDIALFVDKKELVSQTREHVIRFVFYVFGKLKDFLF
jgi:hypothetical protein